MMSLFSVFDPVTVGLQLNWVSLGVVLMMWPGVFYVVSGLGASNLVAGIYKGFKEISGGRSVGVTVLVFGVFLFIVLNNYMGLFSFIFTGTAHPVVSMGIGVVYWVSFVLMGWVSMFKNSMAHLVPEGSPAILAPVLVLIELVSHMMRPFTLSIRLAANMMAGHLIIGLLSGISLLGVSNFIVSVFVQSVLLVLEWGVSVIQGVVFSILLVLYALEYY